MANATAIAVRAASPEEIRHATRKPAARFALTPVAYGGKPACSAGLTTSGEGVINSNEP